MNETAPLVGPPVDPRPAARPERTTLAGRLVTLVPLDVAAHGETLAALACGPGTDGLWTYLPYGPFVDGTAFAADLAAKAASADPRFFAVIDNADRRAVGYASLMRIDPASRSIEVGHILFTPALQRRPGGTEAMYLLMRYAFEALGNRRYEWKCNALNRPSRRAALRLGFVFEGVFRQHTIVKGRNRDTAWYSLLDGEWPARKRAFERYLAPENFDAEGRQKRSLTAFA